MGILYDTVVLYAHIYLWKLYRCLICLCNFYNYNNIYRKENNMDVLWFGNQDFSITCFYTFEHLNVKIKYLVYHIHMNFFNRTKNVIKTNSIILLYRNVIFHDYDLDRIMKSSWYNKIKDLPKINCEKVCKKIRIKNKNIIYLIIYEIFNFSTF